MELIEYPNFTYLHYDGFSIQMDPAQHTGDQDYNEPGATPLTPEERQEIAQWQIDRWKQWAETGK